MRQGAELTGILVTVRFLMIGRFGMHSIICFKPPLQNRYKHVGRLAPIVTAL